MDGCYPGNPASYYIDLIYFLALRTRTGGVDWGR